MSAVPDVACPRCGSPSRPWARFCWTCEAELPAPVVPAGAAPPRPRGPLHTLLTVVAIVAGIVIAIPLLLFVTCVGLLVAGK